MIAWACGWQGFTISSAGTYTFTVLGAGGGTVFGDGYFGGKGASVTASVPLEDGDEIFLVIGGTGENVDDPNVPSSGTTTGGCRAT